MSLNPVKLTIAIFEAGMTELAVVFQDKKISEDFLKIYFRRMNFCTDKEFLRAVNDILDKEQWFPTIKVFLNYLPPPKKYEPTLEEILS